MSHLIEKMEGLLIGCTLLVMYSIVCIGSMAFNVVCLVVHAPIALKGIIERTCAYLKSKLIIWLLTAVFSITF